MTADTVFALSSGSPPAALAVVRISGPHADEALWRLAGRLPKPRRASLARLSEGGLLLDEALVLRFPGPNSATGEDVVELHLHGGRAVVAAVMAALGRMEALRPAEPGEFTRRAFENGRIDLTEAEGLADLLEAETEAQRRSALALAGGALGRQVEAWQARLLALAARVEAAIDFGDEGDVEPVPTGFARELSDLAADLGRWLERPDAERLKDGVRVVLAGPPNSGKSSLFNAILGRDAAITSDRPGTTRDIIEAPMAIGGLPFVLIDTAGLREAEDQIEAIGIGLARRSVAAADIVLWLGPPADAPPGAVPIASKSDLGPPPAGAVLAVSAATGNGLADLTDDLVRRAARLLPGDGEIALRRRHRDALASARDDLLQAATERDLVILAETLRSARSAMDRMTGRAGVEDMLDSLFERFCIGK